MIQVSDWFKTWMERGTLNLLRRFIYDDVEESDRIESYGSLSRSSDAIISGGTSLALINTDKHWNKFLSDKSNLRREAEIKLAIGVSNTPARSGIARSGITISNLLSSIIIAGNGEWLDLVTGWADDPEFTEALVNLSIRDKFAALLEKELGSQEEPLDYFFISYNPADLAWDILTTHGGLDSTASSANVDIDYATWSDWKTACTAANLSLKARFTGQTIREALELLRDLTNSDIHQAGNGKIKFFRFTQGSPPEESYLFDEDRFTDLSVRLDSEKIINYLKVFYNRKLPDDLVVNGDMEEMNSWTSKGSPTTNAQSAERKYAGNYSRKIATDAVCEGAYQDITTVVGKRYRIRGYFYVSQGDAILGVGGERQMGNIGTSIGATGAANRIWLFPVTAGFTGKLESISAYLGTGGVEVTSKVKCAIYAKTNGGEGDLVPNGTTEEKSLGKNLPSQWFTFSFATFPSVTIDTEYFLALWTDSANLSFHRSGVAGAYYYQEEAYDGWPASVTGSGPLGDELLIYARFDDSTLPLSHVADEAQWEQRTFVFEAEKTSTRIFFESDDIANSTFWVDDLSVREDLPGDFQDYYLKEDATSQLNYGKVPQTIDDPIVWHHTLASATSYGDRRIQIFKDPLEVVAFTSFLMGMITEVGDIIRITNAFFGYTTQYFRVHKIAALNLADASISFEAADFKDIAP